MRPNFAAQGLRDVDDRRQHRERDGKKAKRIPPFS
jgi:hypothetical protein